MPMRAVAVLLVLLSLACGRPSADHAESLYTRATDAAFTGNLDEADRLTSAAMADTAAMAGPAGARLRLLRAEVLLMRRHVASASALLAEPIATDAALEARRVYLHGYQQMIEGRLEEALETLDRAVGIADRADATDVVLDAHNLAGQALFRLNRFAEAERRLLQARALANRTGDRRRESVIFGTLGLGNHRLERYDAAATWFEQALAFDEFATHMSYAAALSNAGMSYARLGEFDRARTLQERAVQLHEMRNVPAYLEQALGELGHTLLLSGDAEGAVTLLTRAREVAASAGRTDNAPLWLDSSATALIDLQRWNDAERLNNESLELKQTAGRESTAPNFVNRAYIAEGQGRYAEAIDEFRAALEDDEAPSWVRWQAHAGLGSALVSSGRTTEGLRHFEQALNDIEDTRSAMLRPEHRIPFLARMMHFYRAYVDALIDAGQPLRALEVAEASRARVLTERFGAAPGARLSAASLVERVRRANVTAVSYWLAPARSFAWVITPRGTRMVTLPASTDIDRLVSAHRQFIERALGDPARATAPGDALSAAVLTPVLAHVSSNAHVIVVPDGSLHGVNFETLPVGEDRRYWIEDVTIAVAPAVALLDAPARASRPSKSMLLMGDAVDAGQGLGRLQYAAAEIDGIRRAFADADVSVRRGTEASPDVFIGAVPGRFSVIHFTAHATSNVQSPLDSSIELSPGTNGAFKLYARDIAQLSLDASLVTISACRSAGDRAYSGEGLVGLAWAFMHAGADRVIAGLWDVDDQSTATLMSDTYAGLAAGQSAAEALRSAKLRLIHSGGNFAKPYYWAPFQVFIGA